MQNTLKDLINDLDTSIEFGKGSTISGDYLDTLSQMAKNG
jgi:hypothetical protein